MNLVKTRKNKNAFTLLEMIVATAIFSIVSTICMGIYVSSMKASAKVSSMQKVQNEIRFVSDYISREIRLGNVYYDYYNNKIENPTNVLAILDNSKTVIMFQKTTDGRLQVKRGDSAWADISGKNIKINSLYFYISPSAYPSDDLSDITKQESITIFMDVFDEYLKSNMLIQTTIVSRKL